MSEKILIIDDDDTLRVTVGMALRTKGYSTHEASSGEQGLEIARTELPDLVLSDVDMGGIDGFGVLHGLRAMPATAAMPVILMTGVPDRASVRESMNRGADDYLAKPFGMESLFNAVEARLSRQRLIQSQAKASELKLLEMLSLTQDLIGMIHSETGRLLYLNSGGRRMLGIGPDDDVTALRLLDFVVEEGAITRKEKMTLLEQRGIWAGESVFTSRDGRNILVSEQLIAHNRSKDGSDYLSVVARDITVRQKMEVQLRHAQKMESIGQLAAGIAHEINTPTQFIGDNTRFVRDAFKDINRLLGQFSQLLGAAKEGGFLPALVADTEKIIQSCDLAYLETEIAKAVEQSLTGIGQVAKIVQAMKTFSHPGTDKMTAVDLKNTIESTLTVCRNEWKYVADMVTEFDPFLPAVPCFPGEFNQVILNLVVNAAHAIGEKIGPGGGKGTITVSARKNGEWAEIRISDTGTGIPEKARARIFDPFFTTKPIGKGTGQGLAIARSVLVEKHGGSIDFETELNKGTTFIARLPLAGGGAPKPANAAP
jgi:PAS domain S-box-containing protein